MSAKYGINIELKAQNTQNYTINNTRSIAIIGDDSKIQNTGIKYYSSIKDALEAAGEGSVKDALNDLKATGINSTLIVSSFVKPTDEKNDAIIEAIANLNNAEAICGVKPKFILAPTYANEPSIWENIRVVSEKLGSIFAMEVNQTKEVEIKQAIENFKTSRAIITYQKVIRSDNVIRPLSCFIIALYAKVMASGEYGFAQSFSNRVIDGIVGVEDKIEFTSGEDCSADRLRSEGITLAISDDGLRAWGGETRDSSFPSIHSVVIFDTIIETIRKSQKEAIDKQVSDYLKKVVDDLESFYRRLVANNVAIGFEVSIPTDLNTNETLAEGKIYINHKVQEMPLVKNITNKIYKVNSYGTELIKEI